MKDSLSVVKKRTIKNADITEVDGVLFYLEEEMVEAKPLFEVFTPFLGENCVITIQNKNESDNIETDNGNEE